MYTQKVNSRIQRHDGEPSSQSSEEAVDEKRELLKDAIDESDIVKVKTR